MEAGKLDLAGMLTHRFRLDDYKAAIELTSQRGKQRMIKSAFYFD
jgi:threonine dehydrogenase-like Zn-dependent dehydrogenase